MRNLKELNDTKEAMLFQVELKIFHAIKDNKKSVQIGTVERDTPFKTDNQLIEKELINAGYSLFYEKAPFKKIGDNDKCYEVDYIYVNLCDYKYMNTNQLRLCELINDSGEKEKVWFHDWLVMWDGIIVGIIEFESGEISYKLLKDIKFLDTPKIK